MRPRTAYVLYGVTGCVALLAVILGKQYDVDINRWLSSILCLLVTIVAVYYVTCFSPSRQEEDSELTLPIAATVTPGSTTPKLRTYYLDNLKAVLTAIVVNHHVLCATGNAGGWYLEIAQYTNGFHYVASTINSLSQSYFMSLFFFISGVFVPNSFDKHLSKGLSPGSFRRDKIKRLGLPFLVYFWLGGAALNLGIQSFITTDLSYSPDAGPPWFIAWLIIFTFSYSFVAQTPARAHPMPGYPRLINGGGLLGVMQGVLVYFVGGSFIFMPFTIGAGTLDVAFFCAGCMASSQRGDWLGSKYDQFWRDIEKPMFCWVCFCAVCMALWAMGPLLSDGDSGSDNSSASSSNTLNNNTSRRMLADDFDAKTFFLQCLQFGGNGYMTVGISTWMLAVFRRHFNITSPRWTFFSNAAYAVYLLHPFIVVPLTMLWVNILRACGIEVLFEHGSTASSSNLGSDGWVWAGYVFIAVTSQLVVWPLAHFFRQLPFICEVL